MPNFTAQLFRDFPKTYGTHSVNLQRGREYFYQRRVLQLDINESEATCLVRGNSGTYEVMFDLDEEGFLYATCTCPQGEVAGGCKHSVAAAMSFEQHLKSIPPQIQKNWRQQLTPFVSNPRPNINRSHPQKYVALFGLTRANYYGSFATTYTLSPFLVRANTWHSLNELTHLSPEQLNHELDQQRRWTTFAEAPSYQTLNAAGCLNLSPAGMNIFNLISSTQRFYNYSFNIADYLPLLAEANALIFFKNGNSYKQRLHLLSQTLEPQLQLTRDDKQLTLQVELEINDQKHLVKPKELQLIFQNPPYLLFNSYLAPVIPSPNFDFLQSLPLTVPRADEKIFRDTYFVPLANQFSIQSDFVEWHDVEANVVPQLYLRDDQQKLMADLRFRYADYQVLPSTAPAPTGTVALPGEWKIGRLRRQLDQETYFIQLLTDSNYRLKRASRPHAFGTYELRSRAHPYDFLLHSLPQLIQAGFEIHGEQNLKLGKINRHTPTLRVNLTSGIDWFDMHAVVTYGDQEVALAKLRQTLKHGDHYIKLADGSVGEIPAELVEKYKHLWNLAEETETGFRLRDTHLPLLDTLLENNPDIELPPDLAERREHLRSFEKINSQPLPQKFNGELRPYQKHGVDWLHFLREYKFGGLLADDMGLGKTIQVLAFLQALREQTTPESASLLVVPKSLLTNWQRESQNFTPALRFLEYTGVRQKEVATFNDYDIVITTYGTLLRDIETLHTYRFHYAILDESQAVKNPLAKSSKAVRLINAAHRLVLTGTPVENNTFELWSQFAFTNPGLLGSMDYFKHTFVNPIEVGKDEAAAALLRKLTFPFILRRTKDQVAPELPPRTERLIYTDLDPAQRKLYEHTRERYRAELLGLIESAGMVNARMKVLEGLLRLRQIAIHPALVEKSFRGVAPKFEILLETLNTLHAEGHKALIFSQFVQALTLLKAALKEQNLPFVYLDGKTRNRQELVDTFQTDTTIPFFLISLKAGGVGLNLTAADYVIHLDPWWNPAVEMQASDRAHRIGQDKPVFVYKLIARETVEEKILQLQERKRALVQSLITTEASFFKSLTKDDVQVLFS